MKVSSWTGRTSGASLTKARCGLQRLLVGSISPEDPAPGNNLLRLHI